MSTQFASNICVVFLFVLSSCSARPAEPSEPTEPEQGMLEPATQDLSAIAAKPIKTDSGSCGNGKCTGKENCNSCSTDCGTCEPTAFCGDNTCDATEDCASCAADCGECVPSESQCGDNICDADESCTSCESDCGACPSECGNNLCESDEDCTSCAADCGACPSVCGDGTCGEGEDCGNCASDCGTCPPLCGDGVCESGEDCGSCEADCGVCGAVCGNDVCQAGDGESCVACPSDCNTGAAVCGNGECQLGEDSANCSADCGPANWSGSSLNWEKEVLTLINQERAAGTNCPGGAKSPAGPLVMNESLRLAAQLHSWDQSFSGYFAHTSCNGRSPWRRAADANTSASGETIGWGYSSPAAMVNGWMNSDGHCNILMGGGYTQVGIGFATPGSNLWTAMFR